MQNQKIIELITKIRDDITWEQFPIIESAYIISSIARGDFIEGKSDIDLLLVYDNTAKVEEMNEINQTIISSLKDIKIGYSSTDTHPDMIDILYVHAKDIPTSIEASQSSPLPLFGIFGFDLKKSNVLIFGKDVLHSFAPAKPQILVKDQITKWIKKADATPENATLFAGQVLRGLAVQAGAISLSKKHVLDTIAKSNLPQWTKDYAMLHHVACYEKPLPIHIAKPAKAFLRNVKKNLL